MPVQVNTQYGPAELNSEWFDKYGKVRDTKGHGNVVRAISILRKLTTSPASIFTAGQGYLQTPGNLLTYSNDLTNAAWLKNGTAAAPSASVGNMPANNDYFYEVIPNQTTSTLLTVGAVLSGSGTVELSYFNTVDAAARGLLVVTLTATPTLYATNLTTAAATGTTYIRVGRVGASYTATSMTVGGMGTFLGTYTASQLVAMGGIPLTTAAASTAVYTDAHVYQAGSTQVSYGAELVTNGDFSNGAAGWVFTGGSIASGVATWNGVSADLVQPITVVAGKVYRVAFDITGINAGLGVGIHNGVGPFIRGSITRYTSVGTYFEDLTATQTGSLTLNGSFTGGQTCSIDNVTVREKITSSSVINSLLSNNYILSDGSTGYSAVDGPVGLVLDGAGSVGSELVNQALFAAGDAGSVVVANSSTVSVQNNDASAAYTTALGGPLIVGATYLVQYTFVSGVSAGQVLVGGYDSGSSVTAGSYSRYIVASSTAGLVLANGSDTTVSRTALFNNISVKQVTGIHATQATTANKPTERRGLLNLLTYSQDFTNAAWTKAGAGAITYDQVGPTGVANTAATITTTTATLRAILGSVVAGTTGAPLTAAYFFKKTTGGLARYPTIAIEEIGISRLLGAATVDTSNGTVTNWTAYTAFTINSGYTSSISSVGDYWLVTVSGFASGATNCSLEIYPTGSATATQSSGTFTGAVGPNIVVGICGLFQGTLTAAQILDSGGIPLTTAAAASNATAGRYSWSFDGGDSLALGSVPFQTSDDHAVIAAYRTNSVGGANAAVAVLSATTGITRNCGIITETGTGKALVTWFDGVTNNQIATAASILGTPVVVSGRKVGASGVGRLNGTQFGTVTVAASLVGTVGFIGSFAGAGQEHNGNISIVIAVKGTLSDADMLTLERFAASTLPNAPSF